MCDEAIKDKFEETLIVSEEFLKALNTERLRDSEIMGEFAARYNQVNNSISYSALSEMKPPLVLMPKKHWIYERKKEILLAIGRYSEAKKEIPTEWLVELKNYI